MTLTKKEIKEICETYNVAPSGIREMTYADHVDRVLKERYIIGSAKFKPILHRALMKLPEDVLDYIHNNCLIICTKKRHVWGIGPYFIKYASESSLHRVLDQFIIVFAEEELKGKYATQRVFWQIAYKYLGFDRGAHTIEESREQEKMIDRYVKKWFEIAKRKTKKRRGARK